ncbi:hypothetical protein NFI96_029389 [Prochilodus magdalenae]|nr:hypothetical protein NFI96_029389 [Prochilodus magdalenae]
MYSEQRRPYRGCRAGDKRRERKGRYKPCLPSIIMGNVRSLANKTDELSALIRTQREYRECSILCFTESWLNQNVPDSHVHLNGFTSVRADRVYHQTAAYNSKALPPLGRPDHNLVVLTPQYKPLVQRQPASTRSVRKWSPEAVESLQGCFEATQWDVLSGPIYNQDTDGGYIMCHRLHQLLCGLCLKPSKTIRCFANNKPWVTSNLKHLLNQKKRAFKTGDKEELKRVQTELRIRIKEAKEEYRTKLETKLENNNTRDVWRGLKDITGFNLSSSGAITDGSYERVNELNQFFLRFDNDSPLPHCPLVGLQSS